MIRITMDVESIKYAILVELFRKTGMRFEVDEVDLDFVKDGSTSRVDEIVVKVDR